METESSRNTLYDRLVHDLHNDPTVLEDISLGRRVGMYRLKKTLGKGNFAKVKLGVHLLTNQNVAVKIIDKIKLSDRSRRLLSREITCMERLCHPNVVRLFEVIETFPRMYLVMECAAEGDIHDRVTSSGPFTDEFGRRIFIQVASAIHHMHHNGIIHRDLKAENVFFASPHQVKVGDFGFSTLATSCKHLDTFCGSPPYAAPELFEGDSYLGPPVDIWAMGVLLFFILTGNMPFFADSMPQLKLRIVEGKFHMPDVICPAAQWLVSGMLSVDIATRLTMEDIASSEWLAVRSGAATEFPPSTENVDSALAASSSALEECFHIGESLDAQVLGLLKQMGVPIDDKNQLCGEPRNPVAGVYRILLHHKLSLERHGLTNTFPSLMQDGQVSHKQVIAGAPSQRTQGSVAKAHTNVSHKSKICLIF